MNVELDIIQTQDLLDAQEAQDDKKSYLIFTVNSIEFGIDLGMVKEINKLQPASVIPNAKPYCKGIINIRGTIVPVIDLRIKLGFGPAEYDERACIILVMLENENVGVIVERVHDVIKVSREELLDCPGFGGAGYQRYVSKIAATGDKIRQILDVRSVFVEG